MASLRTLILAEFQRCQSEDHDMQPYIKNVIKALKEHALANGMERLDLATAAESANDSHNSNDNDDDDDDPTMIWQHILDCAIGNASSVASRRVVALLAEIMVSLASEISTQPLLERLIQFSQCGTDAVRSLATFMLSQWFNGLLSFIEKDTAYHHQDHHETLHALQQAVLVRCTDTAVAVRAATLDIHSANDPDLLTAGIFLLQHDPSANNRTLAATKLPILMQTADHFVYRIRDVKLSVRLAALQKLEAANFLNAEQMAEIVHTGYTDRCTQTSQATIRVLCKWYKAHHFKVAELLQGLDVVNHPDAVETVLKVLHEVDGSMVLGDELSEAEQQVFRTGLLDSMQLSITDEEISVEQIFAARVGVSLLPARERERIINHLIPDIPQLCIVMERNITKLIDLLSHDDTTDASDRIAILCDQLLRLGILSDVQEEGSRRVLVDAMKSFLSFISTPDALVGTCVETLLRVSHHVRSDMDAIFHTLQQLPDDLQEASTIRSLAIANLTLEKVALDFDMKDHLINESAMIRQGAIECYGKMGLYLSVETVQNEHWPVLMAIAQDYTEEVAIRSQAALALTDIAVLTSTVGTEFRSLVSDWLDDSDLSGVASEIAVKLLVSRNALPSDSATSAAATKWVAMLLLRFFDISRHADDTDDNEMEVGSPARLQQLLALFLPNLARLDRERFVGCIQCMLDASPKTTSTKIVEYVVQTALTSPCEAETSSPQLLASIQIASFLSEKASVISKTLLRSLCKLLGSFEFDIDKEFYDNLSVLKELLDEMLTNDVVEDPRAEESLRVCFANLREVEMEDEVEDEADNNEEDENEVTVSLHQLNITGDENLAEAVSAAASRSEEKPQKSTDGSLRRSRRLRPSN